jgi:hypothetical protein
LVQLLQWNLVTLGTLELDTWLTFWVSKKRNLDLSLQVSSQPSTSKTFTTLILTMSWIHHQKVFSPESSIKSTTWEPISRKLILS